MPSFRYSGEDRYYPTLGLEVSDGDEHDFDTPPDDGHWTKATTSLAAPAPVVQAAPIAEQETKV